MEELKRTVCNVAYKGSIPTIEKNGSRKPYSVWKNMIYRCYSKSSSAYKFYGGVGVTVDDEWLCYENFRNDMEELDGYNEELFYNNKLELDKDGVHQEARIYSKKTCRWVSKEENLSLIKRKEFLPHLVSTKLVALSPEDNEVCILNVPMFAKSVGISKAEIYGTLSDKGQLTCHGWCFKKVIDFTQVLKISRDEFRQQRYGVKPTEYKLIDENKNMIIMKSSKHVSKFLGCSTSLINQRTRDGNIYKFNNYFISRCI